MNAREMRQRRQSAQFRAWERDRRDEGLREWARGEATRRQIELENRLRCLAQGDRR